METAFFVLLLLVVWISLHNYIGKAIANIESLKKEIDSLRKQLDGREIVAEEECHIPILSVEIRVDEETSKPEVKQPEPEPRKEPVVPVAPPPLKTWTRPRPAPPKKKR